MMNCPRCGLYSPLDHGARWCPACGTWDPNGTVADRKSPRGPFRLWSPSEDAFLAAKLGSGMSVAAIAARLERTERAVWSRLSIKGWSRRGRPRFERKETPK